MPKFSVDIEESKIYTIVVDAETPAGAKQKAMDKFWSDPFIIPSGYFTPQVYDWEELEDEDEV